MVTHAITTPTPTAPTSAAAATDAANASSRTQLGDNFSTFLTLLTSQLQNQDPLSPMDSTQFTQQLVQFSQVEQQIRTNEQLSGLVGQYKASTAGTALSYLGRDAIIQADTTTLANGQANWAYKLDSSSDTTTLEVRDSRGRTVFSTDGSTTAGDHLYTWNGRDTQGNTASPGVYQLVVTAKSSNGDAVPETTTVRETIAGVDFSGTTPTVITQSGSRDLSAIRAVLNGS